MKLPEYTEEIVGKLSSVLYQIDPANIADSDLDEYYAIADYAIRYNASLDFLTAIDNALIVFLDEDYILSPEGRNTVLQTFKHS